MILTSLIKSNNDASEIWQIGFQDPATPIMESMLGFHNYLMFFLISIGVFVTWMLFYAVNTFCERKSSSSVKFTHSNTLEVIWTIFPAFILLVIALPSFALLYSQEEQIDPNVTLKIIGHQWYWSYEYSDYSNLKKDIESITFDSYMSPLDTLLLGEFRFLEVDNRVYLPTETHIRLLITSADVLHSWSVPSFGIKTDACPGRLSQSSLFVRREGVFYGQCSEICGVNHGFMPIVVESLPMEKYSDWVIAKLSVKE